MRGVNNLATNMRLLVCYNTSPEQINKLFTILEEMMYVIDRYKSTKQNDAIGIIRNTSKLSKSAEISSRHKRGGGTVSDNLSYVEHVMFLLIGFHIQKR